MSKDSATRVTDDWRLDRASHEIVWSDRRVRLTEKPFRVLEALIDRRGDVVTRDALRQLLWSDDTFVDFDNNLNTAVATLRHVLGDSARSPKYIETLPRIGYRLIAPATTMAAAAAQTTAARAAVPRPWRVAAAVTVIVAIVVGSRFLLTPTATSIACRPTRP
jgi:DNA-binding winged helix-turn-helix (wHTH) protein